MTLGTTGKSESGDNASNINVDVLADIAATETDKLEMGYVSSVLLNLKTDKYYRKQYLTSLSLLGSFVILGWILGQIGPSFLDLQIITNTNLGKGSTFFTIHAIGYLLGSLIAGILYDKLTLDKSLLLFGSLAGNAVVLSLVPWCSIYELMLFVHIIKGIFSGGLDTCGNAHMMYIWDGNCRTFMQALHFSLSVGGILSPYAMSPFIATETNVGYPFSSTSYESSTIGYSNHTVFNFVSSNNLEDNVSENVTESPITRITNIEFQTENSHESRLYIAYSITAGLTMSVALPFLIIFTSSKCRKDTRNEGVSIDDTSRQYHELTGTKKKIFFVIMGIFMALYVGNVDSINGYLVTFCVKQMNWTKVDGSTLTSVYWASQAAAGFVGLFIIRYLRPSFIIFTFSVCFSIFHLCFFLSAFFKFDIGIWMCSVGLGLSGSLIFPTVFTWTHEEVMRVSKKISSFYLITANTGPVLNPIVLGPLMERYSPMWFTYLMLGESIVLVLSFLAATLVVRKKPVVEETSKGDKIKDKKYRTFHDEE